MQSIKKIESIIFYEKSNVICNSYNNYNDFRILEITIITGTLCVLIIQKKKKGIIITYLLYSRLFQYYHVIE